MKDPYILISACLIGNHCRYDGGTFSINRLTQLVQEGKAVAICPETLAGLSTPRVPAEIESGKTAQDVLAGNAKVFGNDGTDLTQEFLNGANEVLVMCKDAGISVAVLKDMSPSCGSTKVFDGTFKGIKIPGLGITATLLIENGILVYNEDNFPENL